jgi:hypothetical protein
MYLRACQHHVTAVTDLKPLRGRGYSTADGLGKHQNSAWLRIGEHTQHTRTLPLNFGLCFTIPQTHCPPVCPLVSEVVSCIHTD